MKTRYHWLLAIGIVGGATVAFMGWSHEPKLVVHEWGTFTSLQGSDGVPLHWNPLDSSRLPGFVHNWNQPGLARFPTGFLALGQKKPWLRYNAWRRRLFTFTATGNRKPI